MKYHLEKTRTHKTAKPEDKIVIKKINVTKNEKGQWLVDFNSENHSIFTCNTICRLDVLIANLNTWTMALWQYAKRL